MSETTHLICAHCGADNPISNSAESDGTISIMPENVLMFNCGACCASYILPCAVANSPEVAANPNNCTTCEYKRLRQSGWCYMFRDKPTDVCMQHSFRGSNALEAIEALDIDPSDIRFR